jgi:hypothetical protein
MLKGDLKFPVRIFVPDANEGFETENFSLQIRELLDAAGYRRLSLIYNLRFRIWVFAIICWSISIALIVFGTIRYLQK